MQYFNITCHKIYNINTQINKPFKKMLSKTAEITFEYSIEIRIEYVIEIRIESA